MVHKADECNCKKRTELLEESFNPSFITKYFFRVTIFARPDTRRRELRSGGKRWWG